jgi:hypothetical protein
MKQSIGLHQFGWMAVALELILLLVWIIGTYGPGQQTDAAGKGLAAFYMILLGAYIVISAILMLIHNKYCTIVVLTLFALPLLIVVIGFFRRG